MKAQAQGDCFFISVSGLAFGGVCSNVGMTERYALPLPAATLCTMPSCIRKTCWRRARHSNRRCSTTWLCGAVSGMGEMENHCRGYGSFQLDLARPYLLSLRIKEAGVVSSGARPAPSQCLGATHPNVLAA